MDSEQAELAEQSDAASKRRRLDSEINGVLRKVARHARKRRRCIRKKIKALGLFPDDADQLSNAAVQLSNPAFHDILPFPFVGPAVPTRFRSIADSEDNWFYVGREKFMGLLDKLRDVQKYHNRTALWVYGTEGCGKSHLLAALVCYLTTSNELALYVPCNFNYSALDGIILRLDRSRNGEREKAVLFPLQITIAKSHKNSEEPFFNQWKKWTASLQNFDVEVRFLWISIENPSHMNVGESSRSLKHGNMTIHPPYTSRWIHLEEVNKDVWNRYLEALDNKMMPKPKLAVLEGQASRTSKEQGDAEEQEVAEEDQRAVESQRAVEEQGGVEKQMRLDGPSAAAGSSGGEARRSRGSGSRGSQWAQLLRGAPRGPSRASRVRVGGQLASPPSRATTRVGGCGAY